MAVLRVIPAGDLAIEGGDFVVLGRTAATRVQYIRQKISVRFRFFMREWFLDLREGIPYYRDVFVKRPNLPLIRALFLRVLRTTPGVLEVLRFALVYDAATRSASFTFQALVTDGEIEVRKEDEDFLVGLASAA